MRYSTDNLVLSADDTIDLQLHTELSDGQWTASDLIDHLQGEGFALAAITDHDRADIASDLQSIAIRKEFPLLVAVEVSSMWKGDLVDFLCYGFEPGDNALLTLTQDIVRRQHANTRLVFGNLREGGYPLKDEELHAILSKPPTQRVNALVELVQKYADADTPVGRTLMNAGFDYEVASPADVAKASQESGAICVLAHPGRDDGFVCFDEPLLDELRDICPFDGIEAYYPKHSEEQVQLYLDYAKKHHLPVTAGSDSHSIERPPIPYKAGLCRDFLERLGIEVQ